MNHSRNKGLKKNKKKKQDRHRKLDGSGPEDGKDWARPGGPSDKYYGREDEEVVNATNIDEYKTTNLSGQITPGLRSMGGEQHWLGHRAG